jgi:TPR repeat protein
MKYALFLSAMVAFAQSQQNTRPLSTGPMTGPLGWAQTPLGGSGKKVAKDSGEWKRTIAEYEAALVDLKADKNIESAMFYIRSAAEMDYVPAQIKLATLLLDGEVILKNSQEAATWVKRAAKFGSPDAFFLLGEMQTQGAGMKRDVAAAAKNFAKAAEAGHTMAQLRLAALYESNALGAPDLLKAAMWYGRAARNGSPEAQSAWSRLQATLSPDEVKRAEEFAAKQSH